MKLVLAFVLAICAISAQASDFATMRKEAELMAVFDPVYTPMARDGFVDKLKEYFENAIANIKKTVTDLLEKAKEVGLAAKDKILEAVKVAAEKVTKFIQETEEILKDLTNKGLAYKKCVEENKPQLEALYAKARQDVKECTADAVKFAEGLRGKVIDELAKVKEYVASLREAIKDCYVPSKPVESFTCAVGKVKDVKEAVATIISDVSKVINEASTVASASVACIKDSIAENRVKAKAIIEEIKKCAAQAQPSKRAIMQKEAELFAVFEPVYAPMPRDGFLDNIKEFIENAIANIKQTVSDLVEKAKEVGSATKDKVLNAIKVATEKITKFVDETETIVKDLTSKGLAYKKCVEENKPKLDALYEKAKQDVKTCTADALQFAETIHGKVVDEVSKVKEYVESLRAAIKTCYEPSKPLDSFTCAVNKVKDAKEQFTNIVSDVTKIINDATNVATTSVTCIKDSVAENKAQANAIVEEIKACAAA